MCITSVGTSYDLECEAAMTARLRARNTAIKANKFLLPLLLLLSFTPKNPASVSRFDGDAPLSIFCALLNGLDSGLRFSWSNLLVIDCRAVIFSIFDVIIIIIIIRRLCDFAYLK